MRYQLLFLRNLDTFATHKNYKNKQLNDDLRIVNTKTIQNFHLFRSVFKLITFFFLREISVKERELRGVGMGATFKLKNIFI